MRITSLIAFLLIIVSCQSSHNPYSGEELTFDQNLDSMLIRCQQLRGIGDLEVNRTTFKEAVKSNILRLQSYDQKSNFWNFSLWGVQDDDISKYLNGSKVVKMLHSNYHDMKVGEVEIEKIALAFYQDTLVAIDFLPKLREKMKEHYNQKYGEGKGYYRKNSYVPNDISRMRIDEEGRIDWWNDSISLTYFIDSHLDKQLGKFRHEEYFLIADRTGRYEQFNSEIAKAKEECCKNKKTAEESSYDAF